jgi:hypothetical protein
MVVVLIAANWGTSVATLFADHPMEHQPALLQGLKSSRKLLAKLFAPIFKPSEPVLIVLAP